MTRTRARGDLRIRPSLVLGTDVGSSDSDDVGEGVSKGALMVSFMACEPEKRLVLFSLPDALWLADEVCEAVVLGSELLAAVLELGEAVVDGLAVVPLEALVVAVPSPW